MITSLLLLSSSFVKTDLSDSSLYERSLIVAEKVGLKVPAQARTLILMDLPMQIAIDFGRFSIAFSKMDGHVCEIDSEADESIPITIPRVRERGSEIMALFGTDSSHYTSGELRVDQGRRGEPPPITYIRLTQDFIGTLTDPKWQIAQFVFRLGNGGGFSAMAMTAADLEFSERLAAGKLRKDEEWIMVKGGSRRVDVRTLKATYDAQSRPESRLKFAFFGDR